MTREIIELERCAAGDARIAPLLQAYLREWSALVAVPVDGAGRFVYPELADVDATLFLVDGVAVGFAFTAGDSTGRRHIEELHIEASVRRRGLGARAVHALLACEPALWTWTVRPENPGGLAFWRRAFPGAPELIEPGDDGIVRTRFTVSSR